MQVTRSTDAHQTRVDHHYLWSKHTERPNGPPPVSAINSSCPSLRVPAVYTYIHFRDTTTCTSQMLSTGLKMTGWMKQWSGQSLRQSVLDHAKFSPQEIELKTSLATWNTFISNVQFICLHFQRELRFTGSTGPNSSLFQTEITSGWIVMKFCTDIHGPQMMYCTEFGDPLTFPLAPPWDWHLCFWVKCLNKYFPYFHEICCTRSVPP